MRSLLLKTAFLLFCSTSSFGQKYYTLNSGNWNNTTNVWSLNGVTPCGCFPGNSLSTDTVIVSHPINLTAHINASALSKVQVNTGGSLSNTNFDLIINNSVVLSNGAVSIRNLYIGVGGSFKLTNSTLIVNVNMDLYGSMTADFSNITITGGNIQVYSTGSFIIGDNSRIHFLSGNYKNEGYTSICADCCLSFDKGNVTNEATGTFAGGGTVLSDLGLIKNYGTWSALITYCSSGNDVGMVVPENCILANDQCTFAPLPTQLVTFDGYRDQETDNLFWESASETNANYYLIEKSTDGSNWIEAAIISPQNIQGDLAKYTFAQAQSAKGPTYYRLSMVDHNGNEAFSDILVLLENSNDDLVIYPNPSSDRSMVQLNKNHPYTHLVLIDSYGRTLKTIAIQDDFNLEFELPSENGIYFIQAEGEGITKTFTLIKI